MTYLDVIGITASILGILEVIPQVIWTFRIKSTGDISYATILLVIVGLGLWALYGIGKHDIWIIVSTVTTDAFYVLLLIMKIIYDRRAKCLKDNARLH
jgi:MtN3 and saliva related transmembrane protein